MPVDDELRQWLVLARQDLSAARILLDREPPLLETGCFHRQQAVEKVLKGFLLWQNVAFPKVHTLGLLLDLAELQDATLAAIRDRCEWLTRFAVQDRYPHGRAISPSTARKALTDAELACQVNSGSSTRFRPTP